MQHKEKEAEKSLILAWPSPQDYNEALQNPQISFSDPDLANGQPALDIFGLPKPTSGMFASVYRIQTSKSNWAVRCFLRSKADQIYRYSSIKKALKDAALSSTVHFDLQEEGIRVGGHQFPMLKMEWCDGEPLNNWLEDHLKNKPMLEEFLEKWRSLVIELSSHGIAHGDLQHGNVLITEAGEIKLVDYDGMYVPQFLGLQSNELGHPNYQHPGRNELQFGPNLDNFSAWLIYLSVLICGCDPHLFFDFEGGDECIIFRRQDLLAPLNSELFYVLEHHHNPQIKESARLLRYLLSLPADEVPGLESPIAVPDEFPQFTGTLSEMPDWVNDLKSETERGEEKVLSRRKRRRSVPYKRKKKDQQATGVRGRWIYDDHGLVFVPEHETSASHHQSAAPTSSAKRSSSPTSPAITPKQFHTKQLHSPLLEAYLNQNSSPGNTAANFGGPKNLYEQGSFAGFKLILVLATAVVLGLSGLLRHSSGPSSDPVSLPAADSLWTKNGEYVDLINSKALLKDGDFTRAEPVIKHGLQHLTVGSKDRNSILTAGLLHEYLGDVYAYHKNWKDAEAQYKSSMELWKNYSGAESSDYAGLLVKLAHTYAQENQLALADRTYQQAISLLARNYYKPDDPYMKSVIDSCRKVMKQEKKNADKIINDLIAKAQKD